MLEAMLKLKLTKLERFFLRRNHRFVINTDTIINSASQLDESYDSTGEDSRKEDIMLK